MKPTSATRWSSDLRWARPTASCECSSVSKRWALRSALAVREATVWQKRTSASLNGSASRSVRRKMAPMTEPSQRTGTTTMERTLRMSSVDLMLRSIGSLAASGMKTVSPLSKARLSSG